MQRVQSGTHSQAQTVVVQAERTFVTESWAVGLRPDQRQFQQVRDIFVEFPFDCRNRCVVRLGSTSVSSSVECELVEPSPFQPKHGFLEFAVTANVTDGGSGTSVALRRGGAAQQHSTECARIMKLLDTMLKQGKAIDTESLCALPGRKVWSIRCDVCILNDEGNAADCAVWATMAALQHFRRPELSIRGDEIIVHPPHERDPIPLSIHHVPLPITCALTTSQFNSPFVVDPLLAEAAASSASVTIALNAELQVCYLAKHAGCDVEHSDLKKMVAAATLLVPKIHQIINDAMSSHDVKRKDAMRAQFQWAQTRTGVAKAEISDENKTKKIRTE